MFGKGMALVHLEESKVFERGDVRYFEATLGEHRLGPTFRSWIVNSYSDIESIIQVNNFFSKPFEIERSVHQGVPLSARLYALALEPLLWKWEV